MNNQINQYQQRLFYKLFATLPSIRRIKGFDEGLNLEEEITSFYHDKNKDFWFTRGIREDKFLYLFGITNKPLKDISGKDICFIMDFDKDIQFNDRCLGLFSIKHSEIHILVNYDILKERYPYINTFGFKITNLKSFPDAVDLKVIDLGNLDNFILNIEKLINSAAATKLLKDMPPKSIKKDVDKNKSSIGNVNGTNEQKSENKKSEKPAKINNDPKGYSIEKQMETVINAISDGKSREEAAKLAKIPKYRIVHWYNEGKQGTPEYISFFKQLNELENIDIELKNKMDDVLIELKDGKPVSQVNVVSIPEIVEWIDKGKEKIFPYNYFYRKFKNLMGNDVNEYKNKEINRKIFLENFKSGKTKEESAKNGDLDLSLICKWYSKGRANEEPYVEFYNKISKIMDGKKPNDKKPKIPKVVKTDSLGNKNTIAKMNIILEYLMNGKSEDEAIDHANVSKTTYKYWLNRGKQDFGEIYIQFYYYVDQIKQEINDYGYEEFGEEGTENIQIDPNIYAPLSEEYEKSFNSMNQSGIAWVNQIGSKLYYVKASGGKNIRLSGENIYDLYEKVKNANQVWGIRDYDRAKKFIDIPDDFEVPLNHSDDEITVDIEIDPDIYAPLPSEYEQQFNSSPNNKTGIAWVNYVGKKWVYQRNINKKKIYFTDENIYNLHRTIKENGLTWGIKDYNKAKKFIDIPDDYIISEISEEPTIEINPNIFAPLPEKYLSSFNASQKNKTGIAWVNQIGKKWIYQRVVNGVKVKFMDVNIHKLHKTVIENNQIWGITDFDKAIPIIETNEIGSDEEQEIVTPQIPTKPINKSEVVVNYIETSKNEVDVIIKGVIRSRDILDVLNRLNLFKEDLKRIISNSKNNETDIFIELEINKYLKNSFEEKIEDLGWTINK